MRRSIRLAARVLRWFVYAVLAVLLVAVLGLVLIQTGWAKNQLRALIVHEANQYLTATLSIGRIQGSLLRGIELSDITLSRDGRTIISIDDVSLSYSIRELFGPGTSIRQIRIARPHVVAEKQPDGRWNLGALIKRTARVAQRTGPGRPIHIEEIEVTDGTVSIAEPIAFGAAHIPTGYTDLDLNFALDYQPVAWRARFTSAAFTGSAPDLRVGRMVGAISNNADGWLFEQLLVETPRSHFILDGRIDRRNPPVRVPLHVDAKRFAFQEWSGIVSGLKNIAIESEFNVQLDGPLAALKTDLALRSNGGNVKGVFVLDTTAHGWQAKGAVDVERLDLSQWLNRPDRPSDITGHVTFGLTDVGLRPGGRFPVGTYSFDGAHAAYLGYAADMLKAHGNLTPTQARIAGATAKAYGASVSITAGSIGIDGPYQFAFVGSARNVDLRRVPKSVPVPHVESLLAFNYDVTGQFASGGFVKGTAQFADSTFLDARVGAGAIGSVDTSRTPFEYSGEGDLSRVNLHRFGTGLDVAWLQEPRYAGTLSGHFHVTGAGADARTMMLTGGGHLTRADLFSGQLTDAEVTIDIHGGSLSASYDGRINGINPAIAMDDERYEALLTGSGSGDIAVHDLLIRSPELGDYTINTTMRLEPSRVRGVALDTATLAATLAGSTLTFDEFHGIGPSIDLQATGRLELDGMRSSQIDYDVVRGDLALVKEMLGQDVSGEAVTKGQLTGPLDHVRLVGAGTLARVEASGMKALSATLNYDATIPTADPEKTVGKIDGHLTAVQLLGEELNDATGTASYDAGRIVTDLQLQRQDLEGRIAGEFRLHADQRRLDLLDLSLAISRSVWKMEHAAPAPRLTWNDRGVAVSPLTFIDEASGNQRVAIDGTWYPEGGGSLHIVGTRVSLDALTAQPDAPARYGGTADIDAVLRGTRAQPIVSGQVTITDGRVWRVAYERLAGRVDYQDGALRIDLRLDQRPGVWLTAAGVAPLGLFYPEMPERPIDVKVTSSTIDLALLEGLTTVVSNVTGAITLDVDVVGTTRDPHFDGRVDISNAGFLVVDSGARYKNARLAARLATDRVTVESLHVEDSNGDPLEVQGSLGTHELHVGDLAIKVTARQFEVVRNEYGRVDINAALALNGQFEMPRLTGGITISGGTLNVDRILDRTMSRPYSVQAAAAPEVDAIAALNPWDRLGLDIELRVPNTLRLVGDSIQISPGTPLGFGDINLRAIGDLYMYKDPAQPLYVTGSLDSVTGRYVFQGRRFDLDPASSINFRGDLNPELDLVVTREISGVQTRVAIAGALNQPELRLASTPPLEQSDILSLIVFNTSTNQLSTLQQQQLAVRAGTLAAGFIAAPLMSALERSLGIETFEIEPTSDVSGRTGARVTIGSEIAPGLVARFSRNFGEIDYSEATIEYYLSRLFRIRATFSDAVAATVTPYRVVERAGIDLLLFFSF